MSRRHLFPPDAGQIAFSAFGEKLKAAEIHLPTWQSTRNGAEQDL